MNQLKCEMCGGTELIKQDGSYVCQSCGTKYSVEEARKMMVEGTVDIQGTVKVDKTAEIVNLYDLAEKVLATHNIDMANQYTNKILEIDANHYLGWKLKTRIEFYNAALNQSGIDTAIETAKMAYSCASNEEKEDIKQLVIAMTSVVANNYISRTLDSEDRNEFMYLTIRLMVDKHFESFKNTTTSFLSSCYDEQAVELFIDSYTDSIISLTNDIFKKKPFVAGWDFNIKVLDYLLSIANNKDNIYNCICLNIVAIIDNRLKENCNDKLNEYIFKLFDYIEKAKNYNPNIVINKAVTDYIRDKNLSKPASPNSTQQNKGGCYVATCVYGSYDCPEVWTLRRFRDFKLAETWYGRLFIKTYYAVSPKLVNLFGDTRWFKKLWKNRLDKMVCKLKEQGYKDTKYSDKF